MKGCEVRKSLDEANWDVLQVKVSWVAMRVFVVSPLLTDRSLRLYGPCSSRCTSSC
jgi:hypothetical protein